MPQAPSGSFRHYRQLAVIASLIFATLVCGGLLGLRMAHGHNSHYSWLAWNLFLAWLPAGSALVAYNLHKRHSRLSWLLVSACALTWFFFFPNAPYLSLTCCTCTLRRMRRFGMTCSCY